MTDLVIPPEAVEAAAQALFVDQDGPFVQPNHPSPWLTTFEESRRPKYTRRATVALEAALPHLRPLFEVGTDDAAARWALLYSDAVDDGNELAQELRQDLKVATQVGLELGRQEAAEEIAAKCLRRAQLAERVPEGERSGVREGMVLTWLEAERLAREVATRTGDARTDPSGHTDLPPTPDALSNRLPEEGSV